MARATKCDAVLTAKVVARMSRGAPLNIAAGSEGVTPQDVSNWRRWADEGREPFATFLEAVTQARARYLADAVSVIDSASYGEDGGAGDWKAKAWIAERTAPEEFAPSQTIVLKARDEAVRTLLDTLRARLTPTEFARVVEVLRADDDGDEHAEH